MIIRLNNALCIQHDDVVTYVENLIEEINKEIIILSLTCNKVIMAIV